MSITKEEHEELKVDYYSRSAEISQMPYKISLLLAAASGLPLFTNTPDLGWSRCLLKASLIVTVTTVFIEFLRLNLNMKHVDIIVHDSDSYDDWGPSRTCFGKLGAPLFWIRNVLMATSLILFIVAIVLL